VIVAVALLGLLAGGLVAAITAWVVLNHVSTPH
jgi:hypothetical protein